MTLSTYNPTMRQFVQAGDSAPRVGVLTDTDLNTALATAEAAAAAAAIAASLPANSARIPTGAAGQPNGAAVLSGAGTLPVGIVTGAATAAALNTTDAKASAAQAAIAALPAVATTGSYTDLANKPTIPTSARLCHRRHVSESYTGPDRQTEHPARREPRYGQRAWAGQGR